MPPIVPVPVLPMGIVNAFVLLGERGCVVVDAGLPDSVPRIEATLVAAGRSLDDVALIVVTHAHVDHAGGAVALREASGAAVVAHGLELPYLHGEVEMPMCVTSVWGRALLAMGAPRQPYPRLEPDVVLWGDERLQLAPYGVEGEVLHTPGHTPGSLSVLLPGGDALVGDMLASGLGIGGIACLSHVRRPPFEEDPHRVADELQRMLSAGATRFWLGHGGPVDAEAVARHVRTLRGLPAPACAPA